jgi:hypothetical protein
VSVPHADSLNILGTEGTKRYFVPPLNGNYASTPDTTALDIPGDLDLRVRVAPSVWSSLANGTVMAKTGTGQRSFIFEIENAASPKLNYYWTQDGSTNILVQSSAGMTFTAADIRWVRVTHATATGSVDFYTSTDGTTWTPLGTTQTTTVGARHAGTADLIFGSAAGVSSFSGDIYRAQVYASTNGTDLRFDADFTQQTIGSRGFIESTGKFKVTHRPTLFASNNKTATIISGERVAVVTGSQATPIGGVTGNAITNQVQYINVNLNSIE